MLMMPFRWSLKVREAEQLMLMMHVQSGPSAVGADKPMLRMLS